MRKEPLSLTGDPAIRASFKSNSPKRARPPD